MSKKGVNMWSDEFKRYQAGLALKVRQLRSELGLSQEKLALIAGVDRTLVSKIERSIANPSLEVLVKISGCLKVSVDNLLKIWWEKKFIVNKKTHIHLKILASNLIRLRVQRQASLEQISLKAKLESSVIKKIEDGLADPTLKEIIKLATALEVPAHELLLTKKNLKKNDWDLH